MTIELTSGECALIVNCIEFSRRNIGAFMADYEYTRDLLLISFDIPPPVAGHDIDYFNRCMVLTVSKICEANLRNNCGIERPILQTPNKKTT
jgi:hypothetical protein